MLSGSLFVEIEMDKPTFFALLAIMATAYCVGNWLMETAELTMMDLYWDWALYAAFIGMVLSLPFLVLKK